MAEVVVTQAILGGSFVVADSKTPAATTMRAAAVATTSYVESSWVRVQRFTTAKVLVQWDADCDHTSLELKLDTSADEGVTWESVTQQGPVAAGVTPLTPWVGQAVRANFATPGGFGVEMTIASTLILRASIKRTGGTAVGTVALKFVGGSHL